MTINKIETLSDFLHSSGAKYCVFDMGRRIVKLDSDEFVSIESAKKPYPYPFKKEALLALVFWNQQKTENYYVWFLHFPLDEQGLLIQAARDEFLVTLLECVGEQILAEHDGKKIENALKDSPYTFKPREIRMAAFHAQMTKNIGLKPSQFYDNAQLYFNGKADLYDWQSLGMQGVADVAVRLDELEQANFLSVLPLLPERPFMMLCVFLENSQPSAELVEIFAQQITIKLQEKEPDITRICACLGAISNSPETDLVDHVVKQVLQHSCSQNINILATISGRIWRVLEQKLICQLYVIQLAQNDAGQQGFSQLLADVMFMPGLRSHIMQVLRAPGRSKQLTKAVDEMFGKNY